MDERIRVSDSDRDRVTNRLRDFYAEGRLTSDELDERITAALNAKTVGDLRQVTRDLPPPTDAPSRPDGPDPRRSGPLWAGPGRPGPWAMRRHRAHVLPLILLLALVLLILPGTGWLLAVIFKLVLLFFLIAMLAGLFTAARIRRRIRHAWRTGYWPTAWHSSRRCNWRGW